MFLCDMNLKIMFVLKFTITDFAFYHFCRGGWLRPNDLKVMNLASY